MSLITRRTRFLPLLGTFIALWALHAVLITPTAQAGGVQVIDIGLASDLQDSWGGHFKRGRALIAADFDLDGHADIYLGNPGDESFVVRNIPLQDGRFFLDRVQVLSKGEYEWGASAADYDNDGDYDLFISNGGNECVGFDRLYKNMWLESGGTELSFVDVTEEAGVKGPTPPGQTEPMPMGSANGVWGDYDRDGDVDLFVNSNWRVQCANLPKIMGTNVLWRNNDDGTFTDVSAELGLRAVSRPTRHSTFLDIDNDGDIDLFEQNTFDANVLWRNRLVEDGAPFFEDVTREFSTTGGGELRYSWGSFASCGGDFNNDGWEDIIVFTRLSGDCSVDASEALMPHDPLGPGGDHPDNVGHNLYLNQGGDRFANIGTAAGLNDDFVNEAGVMGCQIEDINGDGTLDVFMGNGSPETGQNNRLFLSTTQPGEEPRYDNSTFLIDFEAPRKNGVEYPPYPYRTHGTSFVDMDNDGTLEIAVINGGPAYKPDTVREPNRLYKFLWDEPFSYLKVRPVGNGTTVSKDGIGTRIAVTVSQGGGEPWTIHRTLFGGTCFSAQNGFELFFGLGQADVIESITVTWTDGQIDTLTSGLTLDTSMVVTR